MAQGLDSSLLNLMDLYLTFPSVSRKKSKKQNERVVMKNYAIIMCRQRDEIATELSNRGKILSKENRFHQHFLFLNKSLNLRRVLPDMEAPFSKIPQPEGISCAKKLSWFLRHGMTKARNRYSKVDGSIDVRDASTFLDFPVSKIFTIVHPSYDKDEKRRFVIYESFSNCASKNFRIAALGRHSFPVYSPPGHYQLEYTSIVQLEPLIHRTSLVEEIKKSGYLSQQSRFGGINFCSKKNSYRREATHEIHVDAVSALKQGFFFFGNRFTDVIYGSGKWSDGWWNGRIPF